MINKDRPIVIFIWLIFAIIVIYISALLMNKICEADLITDGICSLSSNILNFFEAILS
jgi:hypothetical protein